MVVLITASSGRKYLIASEAQAIAVGYRRCIAKLMWGIGVIWGLGDAAIF